jgi:uncharacterized protein
MGSIRTATEFAGRAGVAACGADIDATGASVDGRNPHDGATAVHEAAGGCHIAAVEALLDRGADIDAQKDDGTTALIAASGTRPVDYDHLPFGTADPEAPYIAMVRLLLRRHADPSLADDHGDTALAVAREWGHAPIVDLFSSTRAGR